MKNRTRIKAKEPANGGADCQGNSTERQTCSPDGCPLDCIWGEWQGWSNCSKDCGGGVQTNQRNLKQHAKFDGKACSGSGEETKACNTQGCPKNCEYGDWGAWSNCTKECGTGILTRKRAVVQPKEFGGKECTGKLEDAQPCNNIPCPNDCQWQEWSAWSTCSATCSGGTHTRSRNKTEAVGTGKPGDDDMATEEQPCNSEVQCPVDCKFMPWNAWTDCSVTCGMGTRKRVRAKQEDQNGGKPCPDQSEENDSCYGAQVDCNDSSITLAATTTQGAVSSAGQASGTTAATSPSTTEVLKGDYVTGDMQMRVDAISEFMKSDAAKDAVKDTIADLAKVNSEQVEVKFEEASGNLIEAGQKAAHGKSSPESGIVDVTFSIKLNASSGDVSLQGSEISSILSNVKLTEATFKNEEQMKQHKVMCSDNLICNPEVIGLSARVTDEPLTGEEAKEKRGVWPEKVPEHSVRAVAKTATTAHSASCRPAVTWRLVWIALLAIATVVSQ